MVSVAGVAGFEPTNDGVRGRPEMLATQYIVFILLYKRHILCILCLFNFSPKEVASEFRTLLLQISVALKKAVFLSGIQYLPYFTSIITLYRTRAFFRAILYAYQFMHCRIQ